MSMTVGESNYLSVIQDFFVQEGLAYRITPFNWKELGYSTDNSIVADSERFYNNVMNHFKFGGLKDNPDYYVSRPSMTSISKRKDNYSGRTQS